MKRTDITEIFPEATKEQIDQIMNLNGADITAAKSGVEQLKTQHAAELKKAKDDAAAELQKETAAKAALQQQFDDLTAANALRDLKDKVSDETGVPSKLLTGANAEELKAQAEAIKAFAGNQPGYPSIPDGGEVSKNAKLTTREQFANWFNGES